MGKLGRAIFLLTLIAMLAVLIIMLVQSTASEEETAIFRLSIIIDDSSDMYWKNFRKGVDSAAVDYNGDVNFVTLPEGADTAIQEAYILREIDNGADAVVISAIDGKELSGRLGKIPLSVPVIAVGEDIPGDRVNVTIWTDFEAMGSVLADEIYRAGGYAQCKVLLLSTRGRVLKRLEGLKKGLEEHGIAYDVENIAEQEKIYGSGVLIALEEPVLEYLLNNTYGDTYGSAKVFGIGFTNEILNGLDEGRIEGLVIKSDYAEGYLAIKAAYNCLKGIKQPGRIKLEFYSVDSRSMYKEPLDRILFPLS